MFKLLKYLIPVVSLSLVTGCAALAGLFSGPPPTSSSATGGESASVTSSAVSMFDEVEKSSSLPLIAPEALLDDNPYVEQQIINAQCSFRTADPPLFMPTNLAQKGWVFTGRLNQQDDEREMQSMEYRSFFGLGWPKQQLNTWPVNMATLSQMPKEYVQENLAILASFPQQPMQLDRDQIGWFTGNVLDNSQKIQEVVTRLERTYNPLTECAGR